MLLRLFDYLMLQDSLQSTCSMRVLVEGQECYEPDEAQPVQGAVAGHNKRHTRSRAKGASFYSPTQVYCVLL